MLQSLLAQTGAAISLCVCLFALIFGSKNEKLAAIYYGLGYLFSLTWGLLWPDSLMARHMVVDGLVLIGFFTLCWKAPHPWPLWASAFQLFTVMSGVATARHPELVTWTFLTFSNALGYCVLLSMSMGTIAAIGRRGKKG